MFFLGMDKGIEYGYGHNDEQHVERHILDKFIQYIPPSHSRLNDPILTGSHPVK